ncbi:hypothetical protein ACIBHX_45800 [Nonomuraea sp. NPDC050536]|uniref:hypothetical protein n=1 Tax=Nonomuraea sp. NPDC050536 TaxID=3364366 RepID=UPI0037CBE635
MMLSAPGRGRLLFWVVLAGGLSSCAVLGSGDDGRGPYISDARACSGSNLELGKAAKHFRLAMPVPAEGLRFASDLHPVSGEYALTVEFTTTAAGLKSFLSASHLPQPERDEGAEPIDRHASCGLTDEGFDRPQYASDDGESSGYVRRVVVDAGSSAKVRVIVEAMDR